MESSFDRVIHWMKSNRLKINTSKTKMLPNSSPYFQKYISTNHIRVGQDAIIPSNQEKFPGSWLDKILSMVAEINSKCRICSFYLSIIRKLRPYISETICHQLVQAIVISKIDYGNNLLTCRITIGT